MPSNPHDRLPVGEGFVYYERQFRLSLTRPALVGTVVWFRGLVPPPFPPVIAISPGLLLLPLSLLYYCTVQHPSHSFSSSHSDEKEKQDKIPTGGAGEGRNEKKKQEREIAKRKEKTFLPSIQAYIGGTKLCLSIRIFW